MSERTCPKCGYEQPEYHTECAHCGIIFAKYSDDADSFLRATQSVHPEPTARVRPFTLFLLLAYLALGWYAIHYFGIVDKLAMLSGPEEGIARGGVTSIAKRQRVNLPAPAPLDGEVPGDVACFGVPLIEGAETRTGTEPAVQPLTAIQYETSIPMDDVPAYNASRSRYPRAARSIRWERSGAARRAGTSASPAPTVTRSTWTSRCKPPSSTAAGRSAPRPQPSPARSSGRTTRHPGRRPPPARPRRPPLPILRTRPSRLPEPDDLPTFALATGLQDGFNGCPLQRGLPGNALGRRAPWCDGC